MAEPSAFAIMPRRKRDIADDKYPVLSDASSEEDGEEVSVTTRSPLPADCARDMKLWEPASQEQCVLKLASVVGAIFDTAIKLAWRQAQKK